MVESVLLSVYGKEMCRLCWVHEIRRHERRTLQDLIDLMMDKGICVYCGEYACEVEHVVARCHGEATWTVPSCSECNGMAGGRLFYTFAEKRDHIHKSIRRKYSKVLRTAEFDREELREMGPRMRNLLQAALDAKTIVEQRLGFLLEMTGVTMSKRPRCLRAALLIVCPVVGWDRDRVPPGSTYPLREGGPLDGDFFESQSRIHRPTYIHAADQQVPRDAGADVCIPSYGLSLRWLAGWLAPVVTAPQL